MSALTNLMQRVRQELDLPRYRHLPKALVLAAVLGVAALMSWLPSVQTRLAQRETELDDALRTIQNDISELERLKARALPPKMVGTPLQETVAASLASQRPALAVDLVDTQRVRVHGTADDFDSVVRWLGDVQRSHRLDIVSMAANRQDAGVAMDMTLSTSRE